MKKAYLKRLIDNGKSTVGVFTYINNEGNIEILTSLELPWKNNMSSISCIPSGTYNVITTMSNRFKKEMWLVDKVQSRDGIRIHPANYSRELEGCIALGTNITDLDKDSTLDITNSKLALDKAMATLGKEFILEITY